MIRTADLLRPAFVVSVAAFVAAVAGCSSADPEPEEKKPVESESAFSPGTSSGSSGCGGSSSGGVPCGNTFCGPGQQCCSGMPLLTPTCFDEQYGCPRSQRKVKKDINYLSETEKKGLNDELLGFRLATYRYKTENAEHPTHLGFIIDDIAPSPAVQPSGERVDMYGYVTMSVAALQVQATQIAELRRQVEQLQRERTK